MTVATAGSRWGRRRRRMTRRRNRKEGSASVLGRQMDRDASIHRDRGVEGRMERDSHQEDAHGWRGRCFDMCF